MKSIVTKLKNVTYAASASVTALILSEPASAKLNGKLPATDTEITSTFSSENGQFFEVISEGVGKGGQLVGLALALVGFIWVGYSAFQSYKEWSDGRASASDVAAKVAIGAGLIIFVAFLMAQKDGLGLSSTT